MKQMTQTTRSTATESWREKILDEHRALDQAVAEIRGALERRRPEIGQPGAHTWASSLSRQLLALHDQLCRHFRYEEKSGMLEELMEKHPRATGRVDSLVEDHTRLLADSRRMIDSLLSYSEDDAVRGIGLRQRICAMLDRLDDHERHENSLIMDLAFSDLGRGD